MRSTDALTAVAAAPAEASAMAADAAALADVAIPAIPAPDAAAMLKGTPVGRKANDRANGRANGHRRGETVVPLPAMPEDGGDHDFVGFRDGPRPRRPSPACCRSRWRATARWWCGRNSTPRTR